MGEVLSEREKARDWREEQLLDAGYPPQLAALIAKRADIDLHHAIKLVKPPNGRKRCDPETAADILL